jgi:nucleoside-diphosphate kinase
VGCQYGNIFYLGNNTIIKYEFYNQFIFLNIRRFTMDRTFAMVKPDGVQRGLAGEIISRFESKGIKIVALKLMLISPELAEVHYGEHKGKPFFTDLVSFITSGPVVAMVLEGENIVPVVRSMMGATNPADSAPGTIRGDYAMTIDKNIIHGSDSPESAKREISIFFKEEEIVAYKKAAEEWI